MIHSSYLTVAVMRKAPSKCNHPLYAEKNGQGMLMKTQVPPRPSQNIENTNSQLGQRRIESSKFMPKSSSTQKIEFHIEENMTESRISEARNGLQLLKKKMSRNGKSRERQPSIERT